MGNQTIIGSDNGLSPDWHQAITWTKVGILLIGHLETIQWNFNQNTYIFIQEYALENVVCNRCLFRLGLNVLSNWSLGNVVVILN